MNLLFICHSGINRSVTAADHLRETTDHVTKALGLFPYPNYTILNPKLDKFCYWADKIIIMKKWMKMNIPSEYHEKVINFDIEDEYSYGDEKLKELIDKKCAELKI